MRVEDSPPLASLAPLTTSSFTEPRVPWWADLDPAVRTHLILPTALSAVLGAATTVDVVVIGAGVAGLSAAISARQAGARVLVLERSPLIGYGATGRNAGILSAGINMGVSQLPPDSLEAAFWPETTRQLLALVEEARRPASLLDAHLTGALSLAESASAVRMLAREARARVRLGLRAEIWSAARVAEQTGGRLATKTVQAALWLPDEGRIQPLTLLAHLAQQARAEGVLLLGEAQVIETQPLSLDSGWQLTLAGGERVSARGLIRAVGPIVQATARIYALAFASDLPADFPLFWDAAPYIYADYRPGNGRLTVSGGRYGKAGGSQRDTLYYQRLTASARHWLPELEKQEPLMRWGVDLEVAADLVPSLRPLDEKVPGLAIEGLGALGVLPGLILARRAGRQVAQQVSA